MARSFYLPRPAVVVWVAGVCLWAGQPLVGVAQSARIIRADVTAGTVFRDRAQLTATARAVAERGVTEVVVGNLPEGLDPATVQVSVEATGEGAAVARLTLLGVETRTDRVVATTPRALVLLQDSLRSYEGQVRALQDQKELLQKEEAILIASISGAKAEPEDLEDNADLFRNRGNSIRALIRQVDTRLERLQPAVQRWAYQVSSYRGMRTTPAGQLVVTLGSEARVPVALTLTYVTPLASWQPLYDLRAKSAGGAVELFYRAAVQQTTGADWRNVRLVLSGGAPVVTTGAALPELQPDYLRLADNSGPRLRAMATYAETSTLKDDAAPLGSAYAKKSKEEPLPYPAAPPPVAASRDGSAVRFELTEAFSVPADGRPHTVEVQRAELPAAFGVTVVPRLDLTAFLTVALTGWGPLNLLPGRATTYLDGTYTGAFLLDPNSAVDTLRLTLGPDRNVVVNREKSREFSKRALLGSAVTDAVSYVITAKNQRAAAVSIRVEEQVPVAADSRVQVTATDLSGASVDPDTGRLTWRARLGAGETRAWKLAYEIRYPKKQVLLAP